MTSPTLDALVTAGTLAGYEYQKVYQVPGEEMCTRERVRLAFPDGRTLTIDQACSGCLENLSLGFA